MTTRPTRSLWAGAAILALGTGLAEAQDLEFPVGEGPFNWDSYEEFAAEPRLLGRDASTSPAPGPGRTPRWSRRCIAYFEEATGATVNYSGSDSFEQDIVISTQANSAPNIAVFPQPGLLRDLAARGCVTPLREETASWIAENYAAGESWVDLGHLRRARRRGRSSTPSPTRST